MCGLSRQEGGLKYSLSSPVHLFRVYHGHTLAVYTRLGGSHVSRPMSHRPTKGNHDTRESVYDKTFGPYGVSCPFYLVPVRKSLVSVFLNYSYLPPVLPFHGSHRSVRGRDGVLFTPHPRPRRTSLSPESTHRRPDVPFRLSEPTPRTSSFLLYPVHWDHSRLGRPDTRDGSLQSSEIPPRSDPPWDD